MMNFFFHSAHAAGLVDVGNGTTAPIWADICSYLPYCGQGANGVVIITGIISNIVLWTIGPAAVLVILYASIRLITSAGNDETVRKAMKEIILYALLGLVLAIMASTIINYIFAVIASIVTAI